MAKQDRRFLAAAVRLGAQRLGRTWPNPAVGCLIVKDGVIVSTGVTGDGGRPHGEAAALADAGEQAHGATAYVSLEPCNHHGKTPPCTQALMASGVARVVIALGDPDPRVAGHGAQALREAGVEVVFEPFADVRASAVMAHRGHLMRMAQSRPFTTLKLALSADGAIGTQGQGQVPITQPHTNALMHGLRARMDAIAIGAGTLAADDPQLTVRLPGLAHRSPERFVLGGRVAPGGWHHLPGHDLAAGLRKMAEQGITRLLLEGGARVARAALQAGLVDEIILLQGQPTLGPDGVRPFPANPFYDLKAAGLADWQILGRRRLLAPGSPETSADVMMVLTRSNQPPNH